MFVPNKNSTGYKYHLIYLIEFSFGECVNTIDWIENMKRYVSKIMESYRDTSIYHMGKSGTSYLLLNIV